MTTSAKLSCGKGRHENYRMERVVTSINCQVNMEGEESTGTVSALDLTEEQKKRIESNREKAKALRKKRIREKPYARPSTTTSTSSAADNPTTIVSSPKKPTPSHVVPTPPTGSQWDTYGGYILDDEQTHSNYSAKPVEEEGTFNICSTGILLLSMVN